MDNRKPKEDLNAVIDEVLEDPTPEPVLTTEPELEDNTKDTPAPEPEPDLEPEPELEVEPVVAPPAKPKKDDEDYKEKFSHSSREATTLYFKNKELNSAIEAAANIPEPTEDELKSYAKDQGADYDELDEFFKSILKKTFITEKGFAKIKEVHQKEKNLTEWADKVEEFIVSEDAEKFPSIHTYEDEFRKFCMKESSRGVGMDLLVAAFLQGVKDQPPVQKKSLFNSRGNGGNQPPAKTKPTAEDAIAIRTKSNKQYLRAIKNKTIDIEI